MTTYRDRFNQWVEKLENGEFQQGTGTLRQKQDVGFTHCCLGVACEVSKVGRWDLDMYAVNLPYSILGSRMSSVAPPTLVTEWFGLGEILEPRLGLDHLAKYSPKAQDFVILNVLPEYESDGSLKDRDFMSTVNDNGASFSFVAECLREASNHPEIAKYLDRPIED